MTDKGTEASANMTRSKSILLAGSIAIVYICWGLAMSLQAPLFPREAERKGATASEVCEFRVQLLICREQFLHHNITPISTDGLLKKLLSVRTKVCRLVKTSHLICPCSFSVPKSVRRISSTALALFQVLFFENI